MTMPGTAPSKDGNVIQLRITPRQRGCYQYACQSQPCVQKASMLST